MAGKLQDTIKADKAEKTAAKTAGNAAAVSDVRKKRTVAVGAVLAPLMAPTLAKQGVALAQIVPHWGAICPLLAAHSCPESLRGDTLTVAVASDGVKQELHYIAPQVMEGVNTLLGYTAVTKVRAMTRHDVGQKARTQAAGKPTPTRAAAAVAAAGDKARALCESVQDEGLKAALARLGATFLNK
jgi:hypothetical protein